MTPFTNHTIQLEKGNNIYLFSHGFSDQFGGEKGKKYKPLKKLLIEINSDSMEVHKQKLEKEFVDWKGSLEQVDDVCIIGVRVLFSEET